MVQKRERNCNLDIIRCVAVFTVICVHFFLNSEYYTYPIVGERMYIMTFICTAARVCVPLFLLLTGYLMRQKTFCLSYYKGIRKTLAIYLLASLACLAYRAFIVHDTVTITSALLRILGFYASDYAWYIEMYIGLFLLIPFLNLIYNGIPTQRGKLVLIATFLLLTALPSLFNIHDLHTAGWWAQPSISHSYDMLIPEWWVRLYPITYYFIGAYFSEYGCRLRKRWSFPLLLGSIFLFGAFNIYRSSGGLFQSISACDWSGFECVIMSVLTFLFLLKLPAQSLPTWLKTVFAKIADWALGAYLVSWIWDHYAYPKLIASVTSMPQRLNYLPVMVGFVFAGALLTSAVLNGIYTLCRKGGGAALRRIKAARARTQSV